MRLHVFILGILGAGCAEEGATWIVEESEFEDSDSDSEGEGEDWEDEEGEEDWEDEIIFERVIWGYIETDEGWTGLYSADPDQGGVLCDVIYDLDDWSLTEDCSDCVEAWILTRGEEFVEENQDEACEAEGWLGLDGSTFGVGYSEDSLMVDLGKGWQSWEDGDGEVEEDFMIFEIVLER